MTSQSRAATQLPNPTGKNTPFVPGHQLWKLAEKTGRNKIFKKPEDLWHAAVKYFEWVEANPLVEEKGFAFKGDVTRESFDHPRAMTVQGLLLHMGISAHAWQNYRKADSHKEYHEVAQRIMDVMYEQKFTAAAAELMNPNVISRDLGLAEKSEIEERMTVVIEGDDARL